MVTFPGTVDTGDAGDRIAAASAVVRRRSGDLAAPVDTRRDTLIAISTAVNDLAERLALRGAALDG